MPFIHMEKNAANGEGMETNLVYLSLRVLLYSDTDWMILVNYN